ncbi:MAG: proline--tRNA ligase [Epsilonproteobacteria bacterium]|nr:proline--tRNA ligase [Campylobacterota bacterium]
MEKLADIKTNFAQWYQDVIVQAELIDESPTRGCFVFRPYGYAIWEEIQKELDAQIKATGTKNAYFPLLIPESFIKREAKHIEGFSPELAVVTIGGGKELEEPFVVRPTSETIIYHMFERWIKSWRDLPLKVNQWANVVRWEMRTRPFVRSLEFLWQEGHTAHRTQEEAREMALQALNIYKQLYEEMLAIPVFAGEKSESERFAGADTTYTIEGLMQDGKALQMCTSHMLSQSFPASFGVQYQDDDGSLKTPFCTSWGMTTRSIGALLMTHGDEFGLLMPPRIAPIQAIIIPIYKKDDQREAVEQQCKKIKLMLDEHNIRAELDLDTQTSPGAKFYAWELKGVPVRIEVGPKDLEKDQAVLVNRAEHDKTKKKQFVSTDMLVSQTTQLLELIQKQLFAQAKERIEKQLHHGDKLTEFGPKLEQEQGMYQTGWCGSAACEKEAKAYKATIRCLVNNGTHKDCFACSNASTTDVFVAKAY